MDEAMPEPTGRRRRGPAPEPSFPRGAALVAALKAIAARHPLTQADAASIREHVGRWRRAVLGEPGPSGRHGI
ncbi:MAG TPA: hypothetical protein VKP69_29165, partial [Isosphaeraceae bacterium]|nr:hypothetical protein [Isosphaeraceae bacterium]